MTTKTWFGGSGYYNDAKDWSPPGVPQAGDIAVITSGLVHLHNHGITGLTIQLLGTSQTGEPVLALSNVTFGANIDVMGPPPSSGAFGGISIAGTVTSTGTIGLGGAPPVEPGILTIGLGPHATFVNTGTISVLDNSTLAVSAAGPSSLFINDGTVLSTSDFAVFDARVAGNGAFVVGPATTGAGVTFGSSVGKGVVVDLSSANVNFLRLDTPMQFYGAVAGLGSNNIIELPNTPVDAETFSKHVLKLFDQGALVAKLDLIGSFKANQFVITEQNGGTNITYSASPPPAVGGALLSSQPDHGTVATVLTHV